MAVMRMAWATTTLVALTMVGPAAAQVGACADCDLNGQVNVLDALQIARFDLQLIGPPTPQEMAACDVNGDNQLNVLDSLVVAQVDAGLPVPLACVVVLPDFGERVLHLMTYNYFDYEVTLRYMTEEGIPLGVLYTTDVPNMYPTGADLQASFWCVWIPHNILTSPAVVPILEPGGSLEDFVTRGGILVVIGSGTFDVVRRGPGGVSFRNDRVGAVQDYNPEIADLDHELFTGAGYAGQPVSSADFADWPSFGFMDPVPFTSSGGVNLGLNPAPGQYNTLLSSPANQGQPALIEYCHGGGYVLAGMMPFAWWGRGTPSYNGSRDVVRQLIRYVVHVRPGFNQ